MPQRHSETSENVVYPLKMCVILILLLSLSIDETCFSLELHGYSTGLQSNMAISLLLLILLILCRKMRFCLDTISSWFIISRQQQAYYFSHNTLAQMKTNYNKKTVFLLLFLAPFLFSHSLACSIHVAIHHSILIAFHVVVFFFRYSVSNVFYFQCRMTQQ